MLTKSEKVSKLKEWFNHTKLESDIVKNNIGIDSNHINPQVLLASSKKLIGINKGEVEPDDRDNIKYSKYLGYEDYINEHITRDAGKLQQKAAYKMQTKKNLSWLTPGFFTNQVRSVIIGNSLAQNVDGINSLELFDNSHRITRMGMGGIVSDSAIPADSRNVNPSSFGFMDPVHIMESEKIGVTGFASDGVCKGKDNKLYRVMKTKDGLKWMSHEDVLKHQVHIPDY